MKQQALISFAVLGAMVSGGVGYLLGIRVPERDVQWRFSDAAARGDVESMIGLHSLGAEVNAIPGNDDAVSGIHALVLASAQGRPRAIEWLLAHGANVNFAHGPETPRSAAERNLKEAEESLLLLKAARAKYWDDPK